MTNLGLILSTLYRNADPLRDYRVQDDGNGPYIAEWDEAKLGPRPTQEELDAVDVAKIEHNAGIDAQIKELESLETPRRLAEAVISDSGREWISGNRKKIAALRSQRK